MATTLNLPFPPSVNSIWRFAGRSAYISKQYAAWKKNADNCFLQQKRGLKPIKGPFDIFITLSEKKRRKNADLDNRVKVILDAVQRFGLIENDSKCQTLTASWGAAEGALVTIFEHTGGDK